MFITLIDNIGLAAFALSAVMVGIRHKMDIFGILVLSVITCSGGGLLRDIILNEQLPLLFADLKFLVSILLFSVVGMLLSPHLRRLQRIIIITDAAGLGVFTVFGALKALQHNYNLTGTLFLAVITGIGGGIMRDILVNEVPLIFRSEIYILASLIGALSFTWLYRHVDINLAMYLSIGIVFSVRMLAWRFNINLPVLNRNAESDDEYLQ